MVVNIKLVYGVFIMTIEILKTQIRQTSLTVAMKAVTLILKNIVTEKRKNVIKLCSF